MCRVLCAQAAYEVEPASYAIALRTFKTETLTGEQAMRKLREGINAEIQVRRSMPVAALQPVPMRALCIHGAAQPVLRLAVQAVRPGC